LEVKLNGVFFPRYLEVKLNGVFFPRYLEVKLNGVFFPRYLEVKLNGVFFPRYLEKKILPREVKKILPLEVGYLTATSKSQAQRGLLSPLFLPTSFILTPPFLPGSQAARHSLTRPLAHSLTSCLDWSEV
jgi:hypothetical protein